MTKKNYLYKVQIKLCYFGCSALSNHASILFTDTIASNNNKLCVVRTALPKYEVNLHLFAYILKSTYTLGNSQKHVCIPSLSMAKLSLNFGRLMLFYNNRKKCAHTANTSTQPVKVQYFFPAVAVCYVSRSLRG